jgi:hypothetical protein
MSIGGFVSISKTGFMPVVFFSVYQPAVLVKAFGFVM